MVDITRQRAKWFFLLKVFARVLTFLFSKCISERVKLELFNSVDMLSL